MRLIVVGADNERMNNRMRSLGENAIFQNNLAFENGKLREEVAKLINIAKDKESEIVILGQKL
jgi:hypothetical protein